MDEHPPIAEGIGYDQGNYYARYLRHMEDAERQRLAMVEAARRAMAAEEIQDRFASTLENRRVVNHREAMSSHEAAANEELANAKAAGQVPTP